MKRLALFAAAGIISMLPSIASARPFFFWRFHFGVPVVAPAIPVPAVAAPAVTVSAPAFAYAPRPAAYYYHPYAFGYRPYFAHPWGYAHPWGFARYHYWR